MEKIASEEELEEWLKDKPKDWAQVIAIRAALRVFPIALNDRQILVYSDLNQAIWRCIFISWAACNMPVFDIKDAANSADDAAFINADTIETNEAGTTYSANAACFSAFAALGQLVYTDNIVPIAASAAATAFAANNIASPNSVHGDDAIWQSIDYDAKWLATQDRQSIAQDLTHQPLWLGNNLPDIILKVWNEAKPILIDHDKNYLSWIDWYERRLRGEEAAFDIPHDKNRIEDREIIKKIADATDENFWGKGAEFVNKELNHWLLQASDNALDRYNEGNIDNDSDEEIAIPPQNSNAITFQRGETGKIAVNQTASIDEIQHDEDSIERHQMALEEALEAKQKCETSNAGARMTGLLDNYLNSVGQSLEEIKPSMTVQRGEKLRQELAAYDNTDNMLPPVSDEILLALKGWQSAHNMMVGLQPRLNALDTVMLGPDRQPELFPPDDLRKLASDADEAELLEDGTLDVLQETADLAPAIPDHNNRRTIWSVETSKNLIIEAFAIAINNLPAAGAITLGVGTAGFAATGTAVAAAYYLVKYRDWIETRLGNSPTWKSLFITLCDKLEKITPFEPKKPNP